MKNTKKYVTIIGSRDAPQNVLNEITKLAEQLAEAGYILRSGRAPGCDQAAEQGYRQHFAKQDVNPDPYMEIYLPWEGFEGSTSQLFNAPDEAFEIAARIHGDWDKLTQGSQRLHARNVGQCLGRNLKTPSDFVLLWAKPTKFGVEGGTNTAYKLALENNIPIYNLAVNDIIIDNGQPKAVEKQACGVAPKLSIGGDENIPF
jgi:hypothetical protein